MGPLCILSYTVQVQYLPHNDVLNLYQHVRVSANIIARENRFLNLVNLQEWILQYIMI